MGMQRVPRAEVLLAWLDWRMWWGRQWGELKATDFPHMHSKLLIQSCPTLCDSMDCSPPGSSVHGILQARVLEWVPFPPTGALPHPGIESVSPVALAFQVDSLSLSHWGSPQAFPSLY